MLVFVLMFSICAGLFSAALLHFFSKKTLPNKVQEVEKSLQDSLFVHKKQLKHMKRQKEKLIAKDSSIDLVHRYEEDIIVLDQRIEDLQSDILQLWMYRVIQDMQHTYLDDVASFPVATFVDSRHEPQLYADMTESIFIYLEQIRKHRHRFGSKKFAVPQGISSSVELHMLNKNREKFLRNYDVLIKKADRLHDQFQYFTDVSKVKQIHEIEEERQEVEDVLEEISSYLYAQSVEREEYGFEFVDQSKELASFASDIQAQFSAEHEVQQYIRTRIQKRYAQHRTLKK